MTDNRKSYRSPIRYRRRRQSSSINSSYRQVERTSSFISRTAICILILLCAVAIKYIERPFFQKVEETVTKVVTEDTDIKGTVGRLKFVNNIVPGEVKQVFSQHNNQSANVFDGIIEEYNVTGNAVSLYIKENKSIRSLQDGEIKATGNNSKYGQYIRVIHSDNTTLIYGGCSDIRVSIGQTIKKGDVIGEMTEKSTGLFYMYLEIWKDNTPLDMRSYLSMFDNLK